MAALIAWEQKLSYILIYMEKGGRWLGLVWIFKTSVLTSSYMLPETRMHTL